MQFGYRPLALLLAALPAFGGDWNPKGVAAYLDARQKAWFAWPSANSAGVPCVSCHTGMSYLMARPLLRQATGETAPTEYETGLLNSLRSRIATAVKPTPGIGVESVMAALFLATRSPGDAATEHAFERMWNLQIQDGPKAGAWPWFNLELEPYEVTESAYFGASLAALATGAMPVEYRSRPDVRPHLNALIGYLEREAASQPLHNRLAAVWAATRLPEALSEAARQATLTALWKAQQPDGGWTIESLGPWTAHTAAPPQPAGSHNYATAWAAMILRQTGVRDRRFDKALEWLKKHQERESGSWPAPSMNKVYKEGSMMAQFMGDAATAFAVIALTQPAELKRSARLGHSLLD